MKPRQTHSELKPSVELNLVSITMYNLTDIISSSNTKLLCNVTMNIVYISLVGKLIIAFVLVEYLDTRQCVL